MTYNDLVDRARELVTTIVDLELAAVTGSDGFSNYKRAVDSALSFVDSAESSVVDTVGYETREQFLVAVNSWLTSALAQVGESLERVALALGNGVAA